MLIMPSASGRGILPDQYPGVALINDGRQIFFEETFDGNGRTCGTCHPEDNNFTLDPRYIAQLSPDDPLFIAERGGQNPLAENFEKPVLMRKLGLILENTNEFNDLRTGFTMRSVPHILALRTSITAPTAADGTDTPPSDRTGWSGDGSPTDPIANPPLRGSLRDFTIGAIRQHLPKTLARNPGSDFRLPTDYELDALEAFMLSLGRQEEFVDFHQIVLHDERAEAGRRNYLGEGIAGELNCNACHFNGGANTDPDFNFPPDITLPAFEMSNRSFAPRVEELLDQPGDTISGAAMPFDDGFGNGSNLFNVPTVIEAADSGPFFHANQIDTVEAMVAFYASQRVLRNGEVLPPIIGMNGSQVANVAALLRVLNADENARSAIDLIARAADLTPARHRRTNLRLALGEIDDALEVLNGANLHFADAVPLLQMAGRLVQQHRTTASIALLQQARRAMIDRSGVP